MSPGTHAAADGSFRRSAGIQVGRAVILVAVALGVGIVLLHRTGGRATNVASTGTTATTVKTKSTARTTPTTVPVTAAPTVPLRPPASVKVLVANGSAVRGLAGLTSTRLHAAGYDVLSPANATQQVTATVIYFQPGFDREAAALATALTLPPTAVQPMKTPPPVTNLSTANILVIAGSDLAPAASTATSAAPSPTVHTPVTTHPVTTVHTATTVRPTTTSHP